MVNSIHVCLKYPRLVQLFLSFRLKVLPISASLSLYQLSRDISPFCVPRAAISDSPFVNDLICPISHTSFSTRGDSPVKTEFMFLPFFYA